MPLRKADAEWRGGLKDGKGTIKAESGALNGQYSFSTRFESGVGTNPEELIAAAHAGCFSMALSAALDDLAQDIVVPAVVAQQSVALGHDPHVRLGLGRVTDEICLPQHGHHRTVLVLEPQPRGANTPFQQVPHLAVAERPESQDMRSGVGEVGGERTGRDQGKAGRAGRQQSAHLSGVTRVVEDDEDPSSGQQPRV